MVKMIAKAEFRYNDRLLKVGEAFDADGQHADILERVQRAEPAPVNNRQMKAEPAAEPAAKPKAKRTYSRRDIKTGD